MVHRSDSPDSPLPWWPLAVACATVLAIFVAIVALYWPWVEQAIAVEEAPVAWLQSSMLWSAATLSLLLSFADRDRARGWALAAVGLLAAALDERFMGHERIKDWMLFRFYAGDVSSMGHAGDLPMLVYVVGGAALLAWLRSGAPRFFGMRWLIAAVCVGTAGVALDIASTELRIQVIEEGCELIAETLFVCGLLRHAQFVFRRARQD